MRANYVFALLAVVVASAASAAKFVPAADAQHIPPRVASSFKDEPSPTERKPAVVIRGAPVPISWTYKHEAIAVPQEEQASSPSQLANQASPGQDGNGRAAAKAAIEADGYKGVSKLAQTPDGKWTARVLRGATEITVTVSSDGSVSAD